MSDEAIKKIQDRIKYLKSKINTDINPNPLEMDKLLPIELQREYRDEIRTLEWVLSLFGEEEK